MAAETSAPVNPAPPAAEAPPVKKIVFRLDDGTVIRRTGDSHDAEVLRPKQAWEAGLLHEHHLLRMQHFLCQIHSKLPEEGPLKSVSIGSKRSMDSVLEINQTQSVKKSRSTDGVTVANGPAHTPAQPSPNSIGDNWGVIALRLVDYILKKVLKHNARFFDDPVDLNVVKGYTNIIKNPMHFKKISEKLTTGAYSSAKEFYDDVLLICDNCYRYNVEEFPSEFGIYGWEMETQFLKAWARTPMAKDFPPRPLRNKPTIHLPKPQSVVPRPRARPGRPPGISRSKSVNSYGHAVAPRQPVWTQDMQRALINALHDETILNKHMEAVVKILTDANEMGVDEDGEATLDMEKITPGTALKLYNLVVGKPPGVPAARTTNAVLLDDSDEDDEYDPDEEDDD